MNQQLLFGMHQTKIEFYLRKKQLNQIKILFTIVSDQLLNNIPDERFSKGINGSYCLKNTVIMRTYINIEATHK
jgi:hypothetical protein